MDQDDTTENNGDSGSIRDQFDPHGASTSTDEHGNEVLFLPEELDIYINKLTLEAYIFHAKPVADDIAKLEFDWKTHHVTVHKKGGKTLDLGVKIQWMIRPHFKKINELSIVKVKDGEALDGFQVPVVHINRDDI